MTNPTESPTSPDASQLDRLQAAKGFIFDMDGVLYRGAQLLPGVNDVFNALRLREIPFLLATNNSTATQQEFVNKLKAMGVNVDVARGVSDGVALGVDSACGEHAARSATVSSIGESATSAAAEEMMSNSRLMACWCGAGSCVTKCR